MTRPEQQDIDIDAFFGAARAATPQPSDGLMARVLADAEAVQAAGRPETSHTGQPQGRWATLFALLGGWPALTGLASAAIAGLWVGVAAPGAVTDLAGLTDLTGLAGTELAAGDDGYDVGDLGLGDLILAGDL